MRSRGPSRQDPEELEALSVEPELRRWGIGSLLMEEGERRLSAAGVGFIGLAVIAGNEDALRVYERWGIAPSHVRCLDAPGRAAIASPRAGPGRSGDGRWSPPSAPVITWLTFVLPANLSAFIPLLLCASRSSAETPGDAGY